MFKIGELISFHSITEDFEWVHDIETYLDDATFYEVKEIIDDNTIGILNDSGRLIQAEISEYQIHTKESLRQLLKSRNHQYAAICNKIRQLYRKQEFKFQGV
jgi:hypothetical protein